MKLIPKFQTQIVSGEMLITEPMRNYIKSLDGKVNVTIAKWLNTRSNQQNRYLFGVVYHLISEETGYSVDEVHELCKEMFLKTFIVLQTKEGEKEFPTLMSTAALSTIGFNEYVSKIVQFASFSLGIIIPEPSEAESEW